MRVVLTANFSPWSPYCGGGQQSTHNLGSALAELGHDVTVVYTRPPWEPVEVPADLPYAIRWAALPSRRSRADAPLRPLTAVTVARRVARLLDHGGAVVHGQGEEAALVGRLRRRRRFAFVMTPRYPAFPEPTGWRRPIAALAARLRDPKYALLGLALRDADRWCPTSEHATARVADAYRLDPARRRVVPNGIGPAFLEAAWSPAARDGPLLFFGRMTEAKGVPTLADALLRLGDGAPRTTFVGRGPLAEAMRRRLAPLGSRIEWLGWLEPPALAARVARASMVVLPSREESFGNAMAEAMAVGTPLVTTTAGSIPELVEDGTTGVLVAPDDPRALARAIAGLRDDPGRAARLAAAARRRAHDRLSWRAVARTFVSIYAGLGAR